MYLFKVPHMMEFMVKRNVTLQKKKFLQNQFV